MNLCMAFVGANDGGVLGRLSFPRWHCCGSVLLPFGVLGESPHPFLWTRRRRSCIVAFWDAPASNPDRGPWRLVMHGSFVVGGNVVLIVALTMLLGMSWCLSPLEVSCQISSRVLVDFSTCRRGTAFVPRRE